MNLAVAISLYGGGPGSGCTGPNCGRKPLDLIREAERQGFRVKELGSGVRSPRASWIAPGRTHAIDNGDQEHSQVATKLGTDWRQMIRDGWVRKVDHNTFEVAAITPEVVSKIEDDMIAGGYYGKQLIMDQSVGRPGSLYIPEGWENLGKAVDKQLEFWKKKAA